MAHDEVRLYRTPGELQATMAQWEPSVNLLVPIGGRIDHIPPLCAVSLRAVVISSDKLQKEVYEVQTPSNEAQRYGLGRVALSKISAAANVEWVGTQRVDDGREPNYCCVQVWGRYTTHDGRVRVISAMKELDLRDGSGEIISYQRQADAAARRWNKQSDGGEGRIAETRRHLLSHAETKARQRALRDAFAIKPSYTADDLAKAFVVPVLVFTGETTDPEIKRMVAQRIVDMATAGSQMLFGGSAQPPVPQLPAMPTRPAPPAVVAGTSDDEDGDQPSVLHTQPHRHATPPAAPAVPRPPQGEQRAAAPPPSTTAPRTSPPPAGAQQHQLPHTGHAGGGGGRAPQGSPPASFRFGKWKDQPFGQLPVEALRYYRSNLVARCDDPSAAQYRDRNLNDLAHVEARLHQLGERL